MKQLTFLIQVTIVPKDKSVGSVHYVQYPGRFHCTRVQLLAWLDTYMGGRAAEEVMFGPEKITPGASGDLKVKIKTFFIICCLSNFSIYAICVFRSLAGNCTRDINGKTMGNVRELRSSSSRYRNESK